MAEWFLKRLDEIVEFNPRETIITPCLENGKTAKVKQSNVKRLIGNL